mmetsp:Transcript_16512/g.28048  ORF Transcript_16512/g.28048 Transcript_16512/m.28048 type:complete len:103 (-) Transcript_16512:30-338(-)
MPLGESLKMVRERVEPYWNTQIAPTFETYSPEKQILFVAHEHVLRGMVQYLSGMSNEQVLDLRIPNAAPFVFEFDRAQDFKVIRNYYAEDEEMPVSTLGLDC